MNLNYIDTPRLLVCDDMQTNRDMIIEIFKDTDYQITQAENGHQALDFLKDGDFDVLLLDIMMPEMDGFEVCEHIRSDDSLLFLPIILITVLGQPENIALGLDVGATDYVTKPFNAVELRARVAAAIEHKYLTDRLDDAESVLFTLARMVEARDRSTGDHCDRLSHMGLVFGQKLGLSHPELQGLRRGGVLHDLGKLGIPDRILLKKGKLDATEWEVMKQHTTIGAAICSPLRTMHETMDIVRHHHERQDGSGYPSGLKGDEIPLLARVFQIVDIYDALSSERPYKKAFPKEKVVKIMQSEVDKGWWDAGLMDQFLNMLQTKPQVLELPTEVDKDRSWDIFDEISRSGIMNHYL